MTEKNKLLTHALFSVQVLRSTFILILSNLPQHLCLVFEGAEVFESRFRLAAAVIW